MTNNKSIEVVQNKNV